MKKNKIISWVVSLLMLTFLASCADDSPVSSLEEEIADDKYDVQTEINSDKNNYYSSSSLIAAEEEACYYGTSYKSDSWCCTNFGYQCSNSSSSYYYGNSYYSSSSSKKYSSSSYVSESEKCRLGTSSYSDSYCCSNYGYQCSYTSNETEEEKEMVLTLTYYKQKTSGEKTDPEISFKVYTFNNDGDTLQSIKTEKLMDGDNVNEWSGKIVASPLTIAAGVATIYVCPIIIEDDVFSDDPEYTSGYCYIRRNIGTLKNGYIVNQSDYENTKAILEWEWYLY
jgi:hypothetical protein